jgi:hypothetical protein
VRRAWCHEALGGGGVVITNDATAKDGSEDCTRKAMGGRGVVVANDTM